MAGDNQEYLSAGLGASRADTLLTQAIALHGDGRLAEAERLYRSVLELAPRAQAHYQLGLLAVQRGQVMLGLPHFKAALEGNPTDGRNWLSYAAALLDAGQAGNALRVLGEGQRHGLSGPAFERLLSEARGRIPHHDQAQTLHAEAYRHQQAGQMQEAAALYRKVLALMPDNIDVHISLGNVLARLGLHSEAAAAYRRAIVIAPDCAMAHNNLANLLEQMEEFDAAATAYRCALEAQADYFDALFNFANFQMRRSKADEAVALFARAIESRPDSVEALVSYGNALANLERVDEAVAAWRRAVKLRPDAAEAVVNLRNALTAQFDLDEAENAYRKALAADSDDVEALINLGKALTAKGDLEEGIRLYRHALALAPGHVEGELNLRSALTMQASFDQVVQSCRRSISAGPRSSDLHFALGRALAGQGKITEALECFRSAHALAPIDARPLLEMGKLLALRGELAEAIAVYGRAAAADPDMVDGYVLLGQVLTRQRDFAGAIDAFSTAIARKPDGARAYLNLARGLCELGRVAEAFAAFTRQAELIYGNRKTPPQPIEAVAEHKLLHDREQCAYIAGSQMKAGTADVDSLFHLVDGERLSSAAVNPANAAQAADIWRTGRPQIVVVDNFLTKEALEKLRRFCHGSTIWRHVNDNGYVAAFPEYGLACPLLAQIGEELSSTYPAIFGEHRLRYVWAFKYGSHHTGVKLHADTAAINVNFWIAPDEANLVPGRGGLIVWDAAAPLAWDFVKYNGDVDACREFLARSEARAVTVAHRANRAVIFDSDLFHESDLVEFREGYLNRRINITFLYGQRTPGTK